MAESEPINELEDSINPELKKSFEEASIETLEELVQTRSAYLLRNEKEIAKMEAENFLLKEQLREKLKRLVGIVPLIV